MEILALLLVAPVTWPFIAKAIWRHKYTVPELLANIALVVLFVCAGWFTARYAELADTEILNGQVLEKHSERVSCEHSYSCNCRESCSGVGAKRSCTRTCDTCHEHAWDLDWVLKTDLGRIEVPRVDRRGTQEPARFTRASVGDPVAKANTYLNYVKASSHSLFNTRADTSAHMRFLSTMPAYPDDVRDLHYVDRVISSGVNVPDIDSWRTQLALMLRTLGPVKQANVIVVFSNQADREWARALRAHWMGGKKNDIVVVMGTPQFPSVEWVDVFSWSDSEDFKVQLRDALAQTKTADYRLALPIISEHVLKRFVRKPAADFEYLASEARPSTAITIGLALFGALASVVLSFVFANNRVQSK